MPQTTTFTEATDTWKSFELVEMGNLHLHSRGITGTGAPEVANKQAEA